MAHSRIVILVTIVTLVALLLSACGEDTPTNGPPTPFPTALNVATAIVQSQNQNNLNLCSLLTTIEVATLVGEGGKQETKPDGCNYSSSDGNATLLLKLNTTNTDDFSNQKKPIAAAPTPGPDAANAPQLVPGIGEDAFWNGNALYILIGGKSFSLSATGTGLKNPSSLLNTLRLLGRKAASRLQFSSGVTPTANK